MLTVRPPFFFRQSMQEAAHCTKELRHTSWSSCSTSNMFHPPLFLRQRLSWCAVKHTPHASCGSRAPGTAALPHCRSRRSRRSHALGLRVLRLPLYPCFLHPRGDTDIQNQGAREGLSQTRISTAYVQRLPELGCLTHHCCHRHLGLFRCVHTCAGEEPQEKLPLLQVRCVLVAEMPEFVDEQPCHPTQLSTLEAELVRIRSSATAYHTSLSVPGCTAATVS